MSDLWSRKIRTFFQRIDYDGDGVLTIKDCEGLAEGFITTGNLEGQEADNLRHSIHKVNTARGSMIKLFCFYLFLVLFKLTVNSHLLVNLYFGRP